VKNLLKKKKNLLKVPKVPKVLRVPRVPKEKKVLKVKKVKTLIKDLVNHSLMKKDLLSTVKKVIFIMKISMKLMLKTPIQKHT
jgi:hypothetical protein